MFIDTVYHIYRVMSLSPGGISVVNNANNTTLTASTSGKQDRVKVAIEPPQDNIPPLLRDFEHSLPLNVILRDVAEKWGILNPEQYSFRYVSSGKDQKGGLVKDTYITEENRQELRNGDILKIAPAPAHQAKSIYDEMRNADTKKKGINLLVSLCHDVTFAVQFISLNNGNGVQFLMGFIEMSHMTTNEEKDNTANVLGAFQDLMDHGIVSWDTIRENFVKKIVNFLTDCNNASTYHPQIAFRCLDVLESLVLNSTEFHKIVSSEIRPGDVIGFIGKEASKEHDRLVTHNALGLINALIQKSENQKETFRELSKNQFSRTIQEKILQQAKGEIDPDVAHQLSTYQALVLNQVEGRMRTPFSAYEEDLLRQLPVLAFADEYRNKSGNNFPVQETHWKQLGFSQANPRADLQEVPPGVLALDCMVHLARTKHDVFSKLLFNQMDNPCPFAQMSIALTKVLCMLFRIGEQFTDIGYFQEFIPLLILNEDPFKEIFVVTIQLLFKTWREMRAGNMDLEKVTAVVTKQITTVLQSQQASTLTSSDVLRNLLFELSYKKLAEAEEQSQLLDEAVLKSRPVQDLRAQITPEIYNLVKMERLHHLVQGAAFPKIGARRRDQYFYCRLAPNHKILHFGDTAGQTAPPLESLENKVQVSETRLVMGGECPHADRVRKNINLIFSLFYNTEDHLDFVAPTETVYNVWIDGLSVLLGKRMLSKAAEEDLETLINMDLKLRLLDLENISIPPQKPPIPPQPDNFDFYYKLD